MWKRLSKVKARLKSATSVQKMAKLLQDRHDLEQQLHDDYTAMNFMEEDQAVFNMKENPKAFYSFAKSRQKTKSIVGPFIDCTTGLPNPNPDFAAEELSKQYNSVFVSPRAEWKVEDPAEFFSYPDLTLNDAELADITFTEKDILHACAELKSDSAAGADGVPARLL